MRLVSALVVIPVLFLPTHRKAGAAAGRVPGSARSISYRSIRRRA